MKYVIFFEQAAQAGRAALVLAPLAHARAAPKVVSRPALGQRRH